MPIDLRSITNFDSLLEYLADELDWPVENYTREELTFEYDAEDLGLKDEEVAKLSHWSIQQLRPLQGQQPFGIFFVEFDHAKLPIVVLRRILSQLVIKNRSSANSAEAKRWDVSDLIFISAFGEQDHREIAFAHFHKDPETTDLPVLRVLGWDGSDTTLKTKYVAEVLKNRLHWPENAKDQEAWRKQWRGAFRHRLGHVIRTSGELADALAGFARKIRDAAITIMAHESDARGQLRKLHKAFQSSLVSDLTEADFADTYAQTVTYGLLTAAISRTEMSEGRHGTALTQDDITAMVPVTNPFLKEMLQEFLKVGGRSGGVDFDELGINEVVELLRGDETDLPAILRDFGKRQPGEDPVIHFYETFLKAYNKKLRIQRGVFYTPQPVVGYIVRSVHELLQSEFGLEHGLADTTTWGEFIQKSKINNPRSEISLPTTFDDKNQEHPISADEPFVQILDPATGTATFPVEVINVIYKHLKERWKIGGLAATPPIQNSKSNIQNWSDYWNEYVPKALLPRLHAFELMMAPYAIAHMKIGLKLAETGYHFNSEERVRIYLTNALEPWQKQLPLIGFDALAHEAAAVNEIKRHKRFTVVIGNPPYAGISSNNSEYAVRLVDAYKIVDGEPLGEKKLWLQDDYVKFIRLSQMRLGESPLGVLGFITNHGFLDNPTFRGMRQSLMESFPHFRVLDLHGNANKGERAPDGRDEQNVFEIKQGVAITLGISPTRPAQTKVEHFEAWGLREEKYKWLNEHSASSTTWVRLTPSSPYRFFVPRNQDTLVEYQTFFPLEKIVRDRTVGMITARDALTIHFTRADIVQTVRQFSSLSVKEAREEFDLGKDARDWSVERAQADLRNHKLSERCLRPVLYRPFDLRHTFYTGTSRGFIGQPQKRIMAHLDGKKNWALCISRFNRQKSPGYFFISRTLTDFHLLDTVADSMTVFPLYLTTDTGDQNELLLGGGDSPNLAAEFLSALANRLKIFKRQATGLPVGLTPEDIFSYAYAVFHSPGYRSCYAEFLKIDFPRLPLTGNLELFHLLAHLGGQITALHLLESPKLDVPITQFIGSSTVVSKVGWTADDGGTVWIDKGQSSGFRPVPEEVWNFHIGGYQVCEKWLKDRGPKKGQPGRTLSAEDLTHYHKIVIALTETLRLMAEIDQVIETHGGWPGAFQTPSV